MSKFHILFIIAVVISSLGQISLKKAALKMNCSLLRQYLNTQVVIGYFLMFCSMIMVSVAYRGVPLKVGPVFQSLGFVIVPLLSRFFFREQLTHAKGFGFFLIMTGIVISVF